jgi:hypothetical protein
MTPLFPKIQKHKRIFSENTKTQKRIFPENIELIFYIPNASMAFTNCGQIWHTKLIRWMKGKEEAFGCFSAANRKLEKNGWMNLAGGN